MNYIKHLQQENMLLRATIDAIKDHIRLDKFNWPNNYINTDDILNIISTVEMNFSNDDGDQ